MEKKVIQTKEVEEVQTIQLKMQTQSFKQGYKRKSSTGNCYHKNYRKRSKLISVDRSAIMN
jgi:hypothetical protein